MAAIQEIEKAVDTLRASFNQYVPQKLDHRRSQLLGFQRMFFENKISLTKALQKDLGRSPRESQNQEFVFLENELAYQIEHLENNIAPQNVSETHTGYSEIRYEPVGK